MAEIFSLLETIAKIEAFKANLKLVNEGILTEWAILVRSKAREVIGTADIAKTIRRERSKT